MNSDKRRLDKIYLIVLSDGYIWNAHRTRKECSEQLKVDREDARKINDPDSFRGAIVDGPFVRTRSTKMSRA